MKVICFQTMESAIMTEKINEFLSKNPNIDIKDKMQSYSGGSDGWTFITIWYEETKQDKNKNY